jgi:hypothetical protein
VTRKSTPMLNFSSLSVSSKMALLIRRLEILAISFLALADGKSSSDSQYRLKLTSFIPLLSYLRICPGRHMAFSFIWMTVAAILATLEIAKSDETVLPEDGRYFTPHESVL